MNARVGQKEATATAVGERHHALDLLRGVAALSVAQYHFLTWNGVVTIQSMGSFAVYLFFMLSGLTMMMVYHDRFSRGLDALMVGAFFRRRAARLLPLLAVVAILAAAKQAISGTADIPSAILTGTGLMALQMPGFLSNSVGTWSLGIEISFYLVFPVIALLASSRTRISVCLVILLLAQHLLLWKISHSEPYWNYYISNLIFSPFFAFGILISFDRGERRTFFLAGCAAGIVVVLGYSLVIPSDLIRSHLDYLGLTGVCALVVWAAWRSRVPVALIPVATFLGDISYSLYLTHWIANDLVRILPFPAGYRWIGFTALALLGSYFSYRMFENPMRRWLSQSIKSPNGANAAPDLP